MTCLFPLWAHRSDGPNENGKYPIQFGARKSIDSESALQVPCGKCEGCQVDKSRIWAVRMYHEMSLHEQSCFLTLTYADNDQLLIDKEHLQKFVRALRDKHFKLRYFACGEYGDQTRRPHYHMVLFGHDFLAGSYEINSQLYGNKYLEAVWKRGNVVVAPLSFDAICYVAGYVTKKMGKDDGFQLMSRKPGIGKGWLVKYKDELIRNGFVVIDGQKLNIPSQYMKWFEREFEEVKEKRQENAKHYSWEELAAKRANIRAKLKLKTGKI